MPFAGILLSVLWSGLSFVLRTIVVKFIVFAGVYVLMIELFPVMFRFMNIAGGDSSGVVDSVRLIPPTVWFFLDAFSVHTGVPIILGAYIARFCIRRIPMIG